MSFDFGPELGPPSEGPDDDSLPIRWAWPCGCELTYERPPALQGDATFRGVPCSPAHEPSLRIGTSRLVAMLVDSGVFGDGITVEPITNPGLN